MMLIKKKLSKECNICHYWYFKDVGFKYEPYLCNGSYDIMQKAISFNNVAIVYVKASAYRINYWYMSKDDAINIMNGTNLVRVFYQFFLLYIKMSESTDLTYYQRNKDLILNKAKDYCKNNKK